MVRGVGELVAKESNSHTWIIRHTISLECFLAVGINNKRFGLTFAALVVAIS